MNCHRASAEPSPEEEISGNNCRISSNLRSCNRASLSSSRCLSPLRRIQLEDPPPKPQPLRSRRNKAENLTIMKIIANDNHFGRSSSSPTVGSNRSLSQLVKNSPVPSPRIEGHRTPVQRKRKNSVRHKSPSRGSFLKKSGTDSTLYSEKPLRTSSSEARMQTTRSPVDLCVESNNVICTLLTESGFCQSCARKDEQVSPVRRRRPLRQSVLFVPYDSVDRALLLCSMLLYIVTSASILLQTYVRN